MTLTSTLKSPEAVILSREEIADLLDEHGVSRDLWGKKGTTTRTFDDLCEYHRRDRLYFRNFGGEKWKGNGNGHHGKFTIDVHAAVVIVTYKYRRTWLELYEDRQEFAGTSKPLRRVNFNGIAETMKRDETEYEGAMRCLAEELSFRDPSLYDLSGRLRVEDRNPVESEKWPGIQAVYHRHIFECTISRTLFKKAGYVERDGNKTIYFKWRPRRQLDLGI